MLNNILYNVFGAAGSIVASVAGDVINGLVITKSAVWHASDAITVKVKGAGGSRVLIPRMPLKALAQIGNIESGMDSTLQGALNGLTSTDFIGFAMKIPLGCLHLHNDSLELTYEAGDAATVSVCSYMNDMNVDHHIAYDMTTVLVGQFDSVRGLYLFNDTAVASPAAVTLSIQVRDGYKGTLCNAMDAFGYANAAGMVEAIGSGANVAKIYQCPDAIPGDVSFNIAGSSVSGYNVIAVMERHNGERGERSVDTVSAKIVEKLNGMPSGRVAGLANAGRIPPTEILKRFLRGKGFMGR